MVDILKEANMKPFITSEIILERLNPIDVYKMYIKDEFVVNRPFSSPFRSDNIPSFSIYQDRRSDQILFNDFVEGGGNCIQFVKKLFNSTWYQACSRIAIDFKISDDYTVDKMNNTPNVNLQNTLDREVKVKSKIVNLQVKIRNYNSDDIAYWDSYGISMETLKRYEVYPISHIFMVTDNKTHILTADKLAFTFIERKDLKITMKIYQPFSRYKWFNNHDFSVWQGWNQLPSDDHILVLTKSLKDVMSIVENTDFSSVSLQQENAVAKENVVDELKDRFDWIFVLYDNDYDKDTNWGEKFGKEFSEKHNLIFIMIPSKYKCTDFTDLVKKLGKKAAAIILKGLIKEYFKNKENDRNGQ
ncbi:DNA primase [Cellulophaga phage phi14:2]|uniref:DNA primase/helicase, TOPRIM n=1 Tax=Cellulophaga phage phi14:2 TaxID=1327990 RepID=S0A295_9CAUD|nr:DNA primase [Cellulophaga phage phi14:2]AGO48925.1 DNA primase/helicase, TOPRIM [Cellulophaga phage phi14:2]